MSMTEDSQEAHATAGWAVVHAGVAEAQRLFGARIEAVYVLGSLVHGGFAAAASDVDVALILDSLASDTPEVMASIREHVKAALHSALAARLSLFWSSWRELEQERPQGRFPLVDRLDLVEHGRLILGTDQRVRVRLPKPAACAQELALESARFMLEKLAVPEQEAKIRHAATLYAAGVRDVTKAVLFPARFLYALRVGRPATNPQAVSWLAKEMPGPIGSLALAAGRWRETGELDGAELCVGMLTAGLTPLYAHMTESFGDWLTAQGEHDLAHAMDAWRRRLSLARKEGMA